MKNDVAIQLFYEGDFFVEGFDINPLTVNVPII